MQLSRDELLKAYRTMAAARHFEDSVFQNFSDGKIRASCTSPPGRKRRRPASIWRWTSGTGSRRPIARMASASPAAWTCRRPWTRSTARPPASAAARAARCTSPTSTRGCWARTGSSARPGPLAVGAGLSARAKCENGVAVAFYGDGGSNQGLIFEAYNLANIWKLPVIFICEDNGYAEATPSSYSVAGSQVARANGFGMPAVEVDGFDFFAIHDAMKDAVERAGTARARACSTSRPPASTVTSSAMRRLIGGMVRSTSSAPTRTASSCFARRSSRRVC